jgi:hypothetical protein
MKKKLNRTQIIILVVLILLLMIPLIEQQGGNTAFNWTVFDYILAFSLLLTVGFGVEFCIRSIRSKRIKWVAIFGIALFFVLLWAELAVGIFNTPIAGD